MIRAIVEIPTNYNRSTGKTHLTLSGDKECLFILVKAEVNIKEPEGCDQLKDNVKSMDRAKTWACTASFRVYKYLSMIIAQIYIGKWWEKKTMADAFHDRSYPEVRETWNDLREWYDLI